jgi:anti-anti-sigma regulatory factor
MNKTTFQISQSPSSNELHLIVEGPLCGMEAMRMKNIINRNMEISPSSVIIDLRSVHDIDLTGINMLAMMHKSLKEMQTQFSILVCSNNSFMDKVRETKLHRFLPFNYLPV